MDTNCLLYIPHTNRLVAGYVSDEGSVYLYVPSHGGGWNLPLCESFLDTFKVSIYPG